MKNVHLILLLFAINNYLFSNGMAVDGSTIYRTGTIFPISKPKILLEKEDLTIVIKSDYADVTADYYFKNIGESDTVDYIFPVDYFITREFMESELSKYNSDDPINPFIKDIQIIEEGNTREFSELIKNEVKGDQHLATAWFKDILIFPANSTKKVTISYSVKNDFQDYVFTDEVFERYGIREFRYKLKPSSCWGMGILKQLHCTIDYSQIINHGGKIIGIKSPEPTQIDSGKVEVLVSDFDLSTSDDINIEYDLTDYYTTEEILKHDITKTSIRNIKTSSCLDSEHSSNNLVDGNLSTAWVEGKSDAGFGENISIEFNDVNILGVILVNGYIKNKKIFESNNRLKKIRIDYSYKFMHDLKSLIMENSIVLDLPNKSFDKYSDKYFAPFANLVTQFSDAYLRIYNMKITILDVYSGYKYNDTCVSEIIVIGED